MFLKFFILFITVPAIELFILLQLGARIGLFNTIMIIIITGALGANLTRQQGLQTLAKIKLATSQGKVPTTDIVDGSLILIAGIVLLTPGILTDAFGFFLLIPACRSLLRTYAVAAFKKNVKIVTPFNQGQNNPFGQAQNNDTTNQQTQRPQPVDDVIDVKAVTVEDETNN